MIFTFKDLIALIVKARRENRRLPLVVWDDAGVHGGKRTKARDNTFMEFSESFDSIRIVIASLILTLPLPNDVVAAMRSKYSGEIVIRTRGIFEFYLYNYHVSYYTPGEPYFTKIFVEKGVFSEVPNGYYKKYYLENRTGLFDQKFVTVRDKAFHLEDSKGKIILGPIERYLLESLRDSENHSKADEILRRASTRKGFERFAVKESLLRLENHSYARKDGDFWTLLPEGFKALKRIEQD